jgi:hypothetical protein
MNTCRDCQHWQINSKGHFDAHPCAKLEIDFCCSGDYKKDQNDNWFTTLPEHILAGVIGGGGFETCPNFGCVLFEQRT